MRGTAAEIAAALGASFKTRGWWRCRCPAHGSSGPTLALKDGADDLILKCWAGCRPRDIYEYLREHGLLTAEDHQRDPELLLREERAIEADARRATAAALDIWKQCAPAAGTLVETYLRGRGITLAIPPTVRICRRLHHHGDIYRPGMVCLVEHADRGQVAVHRTFLASDGSSKTSLTPDRMSKGPIGGGAVRLAPAAQTLIVGEGIETTLSVMQAMRWPGWAALSTSGIKALVLPPVVQTVVVAADNDPNGAGEEAAYAAAYRFSFYEGRTVHVVVPPQPGSDFNDILRGNNVRTGNH